MRTLIIIILALSFSSLVKSQSHCWQMRASYDIDLEMNTTNHSYTATQRTILYNNSPDTLFELFFHLYFNAFQPGSDMDIRSRTLPDPDARIGQRISKLSPSEFGFIQIQKMKQFKKEINYKVEGTLLIAKLYETCIPGDSIVIELQYNAQVPVQIRRSGRNNKEGIDYSMAQWYPKLCQYDAHGWHTDPYIAREFYGIFADYKVQIKINQSYCLGFTGVLQNPGQGACNKPLNTNGDAKLEWIIKAEDVHDFVWAADPEYIYQSHTCSNGVLLESYYKNDPSSKESWEQLAHIVDKAFEFIESKYGPYPYPKYAIIQGGDGGMEYPMATLITGNRPLISLVGVTIHELMHSWFQAVLATNESLYAWMDEGFTSYAEEETMNYLKSKKLIPGIPSPTPHKENRDNFTTFSMSGLEEPLSTHSDHFRTNKAYGMGAYSKGALCLDQLHYILGSKLFDEAMLKYYWTWRFKHPTPNDFFRVLEKTSKIQLDWFQKYFTETTKTIDYGVDSVYTSESKTICRLVRFGEFPMPVELELTKTDGTKMSYYIPLNLMRGCKIFDKSEKVQMQPAWSWVNPYYELSLNISLNEIKQICINATHELADIDVSNDCSLLQTAE
ncbi:MAG: M1 family metallopeptidase [Saprospiraceae bacterium]|nr:M1 family metallopeptidase [Saprospiraceae bacterium]